MIKTILIVATLATPVADLTTVSGGSLKDSPSSDNDRAMGVKDFWRRLEEPPIIESPVAMTVPAKAPFLRVEGFATPFRVPPSILKAYRLKPGQTISRNLARHILRDMGVNYLDATIESLKRLDSPDRQPEDADEKSPAE